MDLGTQVNAVLLYLVSSIMTAGEMGKLGNNPYPIRTAIHGAMRALLAEDPKYVNITDIQMVICGALIVLTMILSGMLKLGLTLDIGIAAMRAGGQLVLLGYILEPVFANESLWAVSLILLIINTVGAREIYAQCERYYWRLYFDCWVSIGLSWIFPTAFALAFVLKVDPWYRPQYLIPVVGMVLGNVLKGVQLALDTYTRQIMDAHGVEVFLARGATPWEATSYIRARATRVGMTPTIQLMTIMGVVSIPGMMTGQIMGGTPPMLAAKYQIVLTFLIAASSLFGIVMALLFVQFRVFKDLRLDTTTLTRRNQKSKDIVTETFKFFANIVLSLVKKCKRKPAEREPLLFGENRVHGFPNGK